MKNLKSILSVFIFLSTAVFMYAQSLQSGNDRYFTTSDGVKLHYRVEGKGPALVIFPGFGQSSENFDAVYSGLKDDFTIYTLDYRWHGKSKDPDYGIHISRFAEDAKEMIDDAGIDRFYLFAHSMGNTVALNYFMLFGQEKVKKYILGDEAPCLITDPNWTSIEKETYTGSTTDKDLWTAYRIPSIVGEAKTNMTLRDQMRERLLVAHLGNDWRDILPTIKIPTMILMGGQSHFASPLLWNWLKDNIRGSQLEIIEEGGHEYYNSHPALFNQILKDYFLK